MRYREILFEAAGTYSFFRPSGETEFICGASYNKEHSDYIVENPEAFGLTPEEVNAAINSPNHDPSASPHMQQMSRLLSLVMRKGWVRVNYYRGAWYFHALYKHTAREALAYYYINDTIEEAIVEWGPDVAYPLGSVTLYPENKIRYFVRTGKLAKD